MSRNPLNRRRKKDAALLIRKTVTVTALAASVRHAPGDDRVWRKFTAKARELAELLTHAVEPPTLFDVLAAEEEQAQ